MQLCFHHFVSPPEQAQSSPCGETILKLPKLMRSTWMHHEGRIMRSNIHICSTPEKDLKQFKIHLIHQDSCSCRTTDAPDKWAKQLKLILWGSPSHTVCNSPYFVRAAAVCTESKKKVMRFGTRDALKRPIPRRLQLLNWDVAFIWSTSPHCLIELANNIRTLPFADFTLVNFSHTHTPTGRETSTGS